MKDMLIAGLDVGTQGARFLVSDTRGHIVAQGAAPIGERRSDLPDGWAEQDPAEWWEAVRGALGQAMGELRASEYGGGDIRVLCVDSTSGTVLAVDRSGTPLAPAIMYNDQRAEEEAKAANEAGRTLTEKLGYQFKPSFGLPKIMWIKDHWPKVFEGTYRFLHAGDWVAGKLIGDFAYSDPSNALKSGAKSGGA